MSARKKLPVGCDCCGQGESCRALRCWQQHHPFPSSFMSRDGNPDFVLARHVSRVYTEPRWERKSSSVKLSPVYINALHPSVPSSFLSSSSKLLRSFAHLAHWLACFCYRHSPSTSLLPLSYLCRLKIFEHAARRCNPRLDGSPSRGRVSMGPK